MIPQRVALEGFLSYRQLVEFYFDGAPIWMLTGENGAGKSSVFDAITFALYGVHRGGKSDLEELINRRSDRLAVEFDFLVGEDRYRVRRTVPRKGGATHQATHLSGPNSPNPQRSSPQPVPQTDTRAGLTAWVERRLGLNAEAFKMSVLLEQGKSEALLSAKPAQRHELLRQLVNLSRYEALEKRAKDRQTTLKEKIRSGQSQIATLPNVSQAEIDSQTHLAETARQQVAAAQARLEELSGWMVQAKRWQELHILRKTTSDSLTQMRLLLADATQIEGDHARLTDLEKHLPQVRTLLHQSQKEEQHQTQAAQRRADVATYATKEAATLPLFEQAQAALATLKEQREAAQIARSEALQRTNQLAPALNDLKLIDQLRQHIAHCDDLLAAFAPDLDDQLATAKEDVEARTHLKMVQPYAQSYVNASEAWRNAITKLAETRQEEAAHTVLITEAATQVAQQSTVIKLAQAAYNETQSAKAVTVANQRASQDHLKKFSTVGSEPTCPYCGQALSSQHLASERTRLQNALTEATTAAADAHAKEQAAQNILVDAEKLLDEFIVLNDYTQSAQRDRQTLCQQLANEQARAEADGTQALAALRANPAPQLLLPEAESIVDAFAFPTPSQECLTLLVTQVNGLPHAQSKLKEVQAQSDKASHHRSSRDHHTSQLAPLAQSYSDEITQKIRIENAAAERADSDARATLTALAPLLVAATDHHTQLEKEMRALKQCQQEAQNDANIEQRLAQEAATQRQQQWAALPPLWQEAAHALDAAQIAHWQAESEALAPANGRYEQLRAARTQLATVEARLREIEAELEEIPQEARQPLATLQAQDAAARYLQRQGESTHQSALITLHTLQEQRRRLAELTTEVLAAEKIEQQCALLVKYLGRDYLQRFLLQQAERTIVTLANSILEQASGGTLSMELRPNEADGGLQKAFELMVENRATLTTQERMLPAWLLSGSQRFRVAISLALAIGQYASQNGQRIESVIIDEGFGSLDRQGLRDMESALRDLSGLLGRIILVSHQDDFACAFPHRYKVWLEDGASQAGLVDELDLV